MGLLLSILVFSVGVLEALACVRHIQQGILPAWAPRHVTSVSGRRLLRDHWRKSTSHDEGPGDVLGTSGEGLLANGVPSRRRPVSRQGSREEDVGGRPRPPPLTFESSHHVRSPDIHWPEPVPHSPVKCVEQALPSPVLEVPGDTPAWTSDAPSELQAPVLQRRRTSTTEMLPHEEQGHAQPLRDATPEPSFAREGREPSRLKPAKTSSFEEARIEPFTAPETKGPEVINLSYSDFSSAGPRTAVVGRMEIKATKDDSEDGPAPWPIVNIDTVVTSDEEGDVTPPADMGSRRVSFDPVPTVVLIDKEMPVAEEKKYGAVLAPSIKITDDLEGVLRKELPRVIDEIIQEALLKANDVLEARLKSAFNGVSLIFENFVADDGGVFNGPLSNDVEEHKNNIKLKSEGVFEIQAKGPARLESGVPDTLAYKEQQLQESDAQQIKERRSQKSSAEFGNEKPSSNSGDFVRENYRQQSETVATTEVNGSIPPHNLTEDTVGIPKEISASALGATKQANEATVRAEEIETRNENERRSDAREDSAPERSAGKQPAPWKEVQTPAADEEALATVGAPTPEPETPISPIDPKSFASEDTTKTVPPSDDSVSPAVSIPVSDIPVPSNASTAVSSDVPIALESPDIPASAPESRDIPAVSAASPKTLSSVTETPASISPVSIDSNTPAESHIPSAPATGASPDTAVPDASSTPLKSAAPTEPLSPKPVAVPASASLPASAPTGASTGTPPPARAATPKAPSAAVPAAAEESSSESSATSSSGRAPVAGRAAGPAAPVASPAAALAAPQQEAFWVSDASSPPVDSVTRAAESVAPSIPGAPAASRNVGPAAAAQTPPASETASDASKPPSTTSPKTRSSFESAKAAFSQPSKTPSPIFPKAALSHKTPASPKFAQKQLSPVSPKTPVISKPSYSRFGGTSFSPATKLATSPVSSTFLAPTPKIPFGSKGLSSSTSSYSTVTTRSFESIPAAVPTPVPDPSPVPKAPESSTVVSPSQERPSPTPNTAAAASAAAPTLTPASDIRPSSPTPSRDPQEVVRRIAELRRTNPTVASEVLLSILGFKFPGS